MYLVTLFTILYRLIQYILFIIYIFICIVMESLGYNNVIASYDCFACYVHLTSKITCSRPHLEPELSGLRRLSRAMLPSHSPTASRLGLLAEKSRAVTLLWHRNTHSGHCSQQTVTTLITPSHEPRSRSF